MSIDTPLPQLPQDSVNSDDQLLLPLPPPLHLKYDKYSNITAIIAGLASGNAVT